jgi:hypothetical protein
MATELAHFPSKSKPGKHYTVAKGKDNKIYCDCWQWKKTRNCKHVEKYMAEYVLKVLGDKEIKEQINKINNAINSVQPEEEDVESRLDNLLDELFPS